MKKLTNTELLKAFPTALLRSLDGQRQFVVQMGMQRNACPNCGELHNLPEAAGVSVDDFNFEDHGSDRIGPCRKCGRTLIYTLPMFGSYGWRWRLDPAEAQKSTPKTDAKAGT